MKYGDFFPSAYLKAEDVPDGKRYTLTIKEVVPEELVKGEKPKPVASFTKTDKRLVINKTNWHIIEALYGEDSDDWTGKRITIYSGRTSMAGKPCRGLMVEEQEPGQPSNGNGHAAAPAQTNGRQYDARRPADKPALPPRRNIPPMTQTEVEQDWDGIGDGDSGDDGPPF